MKRLDEARGFTIVESMIVLAVTGAMFIVAMLAFNGQQSKARFAQSTRDIESKIQDVSNDISAGYFPDTDDWNCRASVSGPPSFEPATASDQQGTKEDCIFVGKAVQLGVNDANCGANCVQMRIVTLVGNRQASSATEVDYEVTSLAEAKQRAAPEDYNEVYNLAGGMGFKSIFDDNDQPIGGLAFVSSFAGYSGGDAISGSQSTALYRVSGTLGGGKESFDEKVDDIRDNDRIPKATICLQDAPSGGRQAALIVTEKTAGVGTQLFVDDTVPEVCK